MSTTDRLRTRINSFNHKFFVRHASAFAFHPCQISLLMIFSYIFHGYDYGYSFCYDSVSFFYLLDDTLLHGHSHNASIQLCRIESSYDSLCHDFFVASHPEIVFFLYVATLQLNTRYGSLRRRRRRRQRLSYRWHRVLLHQSSFSYHLKNRRALSLPYNFFQHCCRHCSEH